MTQDECGVPSAISTLLVINGGLGEAKNVTVSDLAPCPRSAITIQDAQGNPRVYEGILLTDVFQQAGVPQGEQLHEENMALCLVIEATDGYQVVFALPEFDPGFGDRTALLADRRDGHQGK